MSMRLPAPDREMRRGPQCHAAFVWTEHAAVLSGETGWTLNPSKDRLRDKTAWVSENLRYGYREPVDVS
jgi:hypothetical protein